MNAPAILSPDLILRTGARYELVPFERLADSERQSLRTHEEGFQYFGVVRPKLPALGPCKVVDRDLALLLYCLREPGPLPGFARRGLESERLAQLVADGILEVAEGGEFLCGLAGLALLVPPKTAGKRSYISRLSHSALRYAAALDLYDPALLASRLYAYHRLPLSTGWLRRLPNSAAVLRHLGADGGRLEAQLAGWVAHDLGDSSGWFAWSRVGTSGDLPAGKALYKLYVSPVVEALPGAAGELIEALRRVPDACFKVGANALDLLRPDKLIAHFSHLEDLLSTAEHLSSRLDGLSVHGVPFTAELGAGGLLSWGLDPPRCDSASRGACASESWRGWVTRRLAGFLCAGGEGTAKPQDEKFALERLRLEGVDVESWTPSLALWRQA